jgi:chorismate mutase
MNTKPKYYIIEADMLPEVLLKVVEVNRLLQSGRVKTIHEAARQVGISRSAYYKYRNSIRPFYELTHDRIVTFHILLHDEPGILSSILGLMAQGGANILTINQSIPINEQAAVTISISTGSMQVSVEELMKQAAALDGVAKFEILASE